jgi:hypothetical protein
LARVTQAAFLFDLLGFSGGEIGGDAAVDGVEQEHRRPLLATSAA